MYQCIKIKKFIRQMSCVFKRFVKCQDMLLVLKKIRPDIKV